MDDDRPSRFEATLDHFGELLLDRSSPDVFDALFRSTRYFEGEMKLIAKALQDACYDLGSDRKGRRFLEAQYWIMAPREERIFSFENVCDVLGLNSCYIRERLRKMHRLSSKAELPPPPVRKPGSGRSKGFRVKVKGGPR